MSGVERNMVYLIVVSTYPAKQAEKIGKRYMEVFKKFPPDRSLAKPVVEAAVKATTEGIRVIGISEVRKGKYEEALDRTAKSMLEYADIDGFKFSIDTYMTLVEALDTLGMKPPE